MTTTNPTQEYDVRVLLDFDTEELLDPEYLSLCATCPTEEDTNDD